MSWAFPVDAREASRFWWLGGPFFVMPMVVPILWWWQLYFSTDAAIKALPITVVCGPLLGWFMIKRSVWLAKAGLHPQYSPAQELPWGKSAMAFVFMVALAWGWALLGLAVVALPQAAVEERVFTVSQVEHCTSKCLGCRTQVKLAGWVGYSEAPVCAGSLAPEPRVGEPLRVRGRFDPIVQYVNSVERPRR